LNGIKETSKGINDSGKSLLLQLSHQLIHIRHLAISLRTVGPLTEIIAILGVVYMQV